MSSNYVNDKPVGASSDGGAPPLAPVSPLREPSALTGSRPRSAANRSREEALTKLGRRRQPWWLYAVVALLVVGGAAGFYRKSRHRAPPQRYMTTHVTRGNLTEQIRATGTVQPLLQVQVGAQVSGRVSTVAVDFNSHVHQGDLLAEIDPTQYHASVAQARAGLLSSRAQLAQARANLVLAERNLVRAQQLRERGLNAPADLDTAVGTRDAAHATVGVAQAGVAQSEASLASAETNLTYTRIFAPIDGVVATRSVDPGQTVAASFQTPTLFLIANDLTHMRVIADVDEANIGKLHEGMNATAHVDAFPHELFHGRVTELRIGPTTTNGVVTYPTVIDVANPEQKLRPGMTATITVITQRHENVLRVQNGALRYRPAPPPGHDAGGPEHGGGRHFASDDPQDLGNNGTLYVMRGGQAVRVPVTVGLTDGVNTEVEGDGLTEGAEVVLDETDPTTGQPRGNQPRMRMF